MDAACPRARLTRRIARMAKPIKLRTKRLLLRPFELSDAPDVHEYAKDPDWSLFMKVPKPYTFRDAEEFVARSFLTDWDVSPIFAITLGCAVVGSIDVRVDLRHSNAEIGYSLGKPHWGQGIMAEAGVAAVDWAFGSFELARIFARTDLENRQSWRVMEKLGMQREGVNRSSGPSARYPDRREDIVTYSILRDEWYESGAGKSYKVEAISDSSE